MKGARIVRHYVFTCLWLLSPWTILIIGCVPEYAFVEVQGTLDIEDSTSRTLAVRFKSNNRWACVHDDATIVNGELVEAKLKATNEAASDFSIGSIRADKFDDASYTVSIIEGGRKVNLHLVPALCRDKVGPYAYHEVVVVKLSIPRRLEEAKVVYPVETKNE